MHLSPTADDHRSSNRHATSSSGAGPVLITNVLIRQCSTLSPTANRNDSPVAAHVATASLSALDNATVYRPYSPAHSLPAPARTPPGCRSQLDARSSHPDRLALIPGQAPPLV